MSADRIGAAAKAAGFLVESWMTNPPRPGLYYATPDQLQAFADAVAKMERERILSLCHEQGAIYDAKMGQAIESGDDEKLNRSLLFKNCIENIMGWIESGRETMRREQEE